MDLTSENSMEKCLVQNVHIQAVSPSKTGLTLIMDGCACMFFVSF